MPQVFVGGTNGKDKARVKKRNILRMYDLVRRCLFNLKPFC